MQAALSSASASQSRNRYVLGTTRRSLIPVRWVIHSSDVVKQRASRWLSTTQSGTAMPVPMIFALRMAAFREGRVTAAASLLPALESCQGFGITSIAGTCGAPALRASEPGRALLEERPEAFAVV